MWHFFFLRGYKVHMTTPSNTASSLLPGHFPLEPTCFSPWELASLKVVYHRFDDRHKGYLDADDLRRVCTACHLVLTAEEFRTLVVVMDANGDERFSFEEFVTFLALSGPDHPGAVQMRERLMSADAASLTAGAALGILPFVKHQLFVILGTLFYDPIRLFRDSFVDYSATLRHRLHVREQRNSNTAAASGGVQSSASSSGYTACTRRMNVSSSSCATPDASLLHVARAHARGSHIGKTFGWLTYTISLDCVVGAAMFLSYSRARRWCIEQGEVIHHRNTRRAHHQESLHGRNRMSDNDVRVNCATATAPTEANDIMFTSECCLGDQSGNATAPTVSGLLFNEVADPMHRQAWRERPVARMQRLLEIVPGLAMHGHPLRLEAVAGGVGGAVSGLCQGPCHYLATFGNANISGHLQHHHASVDDAASSMATRAATHQEAASSLSHTKPGHDRRAAVAARCHRGCFFAFRGTTGSVLRNAAGHAAFFSAFSGARAVLLRSFFGPDAWAAMSLRRTTLGDTFVTAAAGCTAGAAYRTVSVPITNIQNSYYRYIALHSPASEHKRLLRRPQVRSWLRQSFQAHHTNNPNMLGVASCITAASSVRKFAFRGYVESLMYTMPVTGVAFLAYELVLLRT